jgi:hypothetical protein
VLIRDGEKRLVDVSERARQQVSVAGNEIEAASDRRHHDLRAALA